MTSVDKEARAARLAHADCDSAVWDAMVADLRALHGDTPDPLHGEVLVNMVDRVVVTDADVVCCDVLRGAYAAAIDCAFYMRRAVNEVNVQVAPDESGERGVRWRVYEDALRMVFAVWRRIAARDGGVR